MKPFPAAMVLPLLALALLSAGCSDSNKPAQTQAEAGGAKAKPLVFCADASPEGFDPALWDSASTSNVTSQIFQGLIALERGTTTLRPELAERWAVSPDARVFTFHLRQNVAFHSTPWFQPTRAMNADDVLFTFGRMLEPEHPFHKAFPATYIYAQSLGLAQMIEGIDRVDDFTVRFRLKAPNVTFLSVFAAAFSGIHSAEYAAQLLREGRASAINNQPIGTGPYQFRSYRKDDVLRMDTHPGFWRGTQRTHKLIYSISREPNVRVQKLARGECHVAAAIRDVDITALSGHPNVQVLSKQALNISYLAFHMGKAPTNKREVREALDIAIDRDALFKVLFPRGDAMQAVSAFPPQIAGYNKALRNEYNPQRAKALLQAAGLAQGFEIDLWALPIARPTNPNGQLMAQMIQADWAKIGVKTSIRSFEWGEYLKRANKGEHQVYMSGWSGEMGDADEFLTPNLSCAANRAGGFKWCNEAFEKLIDEARATPDQASRSALYERAQEIFKHERPWITMAHSSVYIPIRKDVRGFKMAPNASVEFEGVWRE
jgi:ABC-type transport system substrate-binding protein